MFELKQASTDRKLPFRITNAAGAGVEGLASSGVTVTYSCNGGAATNYDTTGNWVEAGTSGSLSGDYWLTPSSGMTGTLGPLMVAAVDGSGNEAHLLCNVVANYESDTFNSLSGVALQTTLTGKPSLSDIENSSVLAKEETVASRLATSGYTTPDNDGILSINQNTSGIPSDIATTGTIVAYTSGISTFDPASSSVIVGSYDVGQSPGEQVVLSGVALQVTLTGKPSLEDIEGSTILAKEETLNSRLATSGYTSPDNASIAVINQNTSGIPADIATTGTVVAYTSGLSVFDAASSSVIVGSYEIGQSPSEQVNLSGVALQATLTGKPSLADIENSSTIAKEETVASRLATSGYTAPDNASVTSILGYTSGITSDLTEVTSGLALETTLTGKPSLEAIEGALSGMAAILDNVNTMIEIDGIVYRLTANALEQVPSSSGGTSTLTSGEVATIVESYTAELVTSAQASLIEALVWSRLASSGYTAPANSSIGLILEYTSGVASDLVEVTSGLATTVEVDAYTSGLSTLTSAQVTSIVNSYTSGAATSAQSVALAATLASITSTLTGLATSSGVTSATSGIAALGTDLTSLLKLSTNKLVETDNGDGTYTIIVYADNNVTPLFTYTYTVATNTRSKAT